LAGVRASHNIGRHDKTNAMLKQYCKTAVRNLWKQKVFSFINIIGLTIGLASFLLIALFIFDELTFDRLHTKGDHIYRVVENKTSAEGITTSRASTGFQVSASAMAQFPEIKEVARISHFWRPDIRPGNNKAKVFHEELIAANPGFLTVFSFPLLYGDRNSALTDPKSVVLTEETAQKFFGSSNVVGQVLFFDDDAVPYKVTGVLENFPLNSSISCNLLISEATIQQHFTSDWASGAFASYFLLGKNVDIAALNNKLDKLIAAHHKADPGVKSGVQLQAMNDVHFYSNDIAGDSGKRGNITYIYVFFVVACFIIFIACINYMNLSTARFTSRGKEIAIRKVAGASRTMLVKQFLVEALIVTLLSVLMAIVLVELALPAFNGFTEKQLALDLHTDCRIWTGVLLMIIVVVLAAGLYPALFQAGLNPLLLLKSKINLGRGNVSLRRSLVVVQFVISIALMAATIVIYRQMQYVDKKDMGFDKEKLLVIDINSGEIKRSVAAIKEEFAKLSPVKSVTVTSTVPGAWKAIPLVKVNTDNSNPTTGKDMYFFGVDGQFLSTYHIDLVKGRNFFPMGNADADAVLVNETAAKELGITNALGQPFTILSAKFGSDNRSAVEKPFTVNVAGIVKDFNFQSLHEPLAPMVIGYNKSIGLSFGYLTVKLTGGEMEATLQKMKAILHSIDQNHPFEYHFLDKQWELLYRDDKIRQAVFLSLSLLAIFIAALGLLGLTIYAAEQRVKEIGIRKVLGASVSGIVLLLSKDFLKLAAVKGFLKTGVDRCRYCYAHCLVAHAPMARRFCLSDQHQWMVFCIVDGDGDPAGDGHHRFTGCKSSRSQSGAIAPD
jgi:putative ABC transport system permease protein